MTDTEQQHDIHLTPPGEHQAIPTKEVRATRCASSTKTVASMNTAPILICEYNIHRKGIIIGNMTNGNCFVLLSSEDSLMPNPTIATGAVATKLIRPFDSWEVPFGYCGRIYAMIGGGGAAAEQITVTELF